MLDQALRKRRAKTALKIGAIAIPIILIVMWFYPVATVGTHSGTAVSVTSQHSDEGTTLRLVVVLDKGDRITASMGRRMTFKPGAKVLVREKRTLFGFSRYSLVRYEDG